MFWHIRNYLSEKTVIYIVHKKENRNTNKTTVYKYEVQASKLNSFERLLIKYLMIGVQNIAKKHLEFLFF